MGRLRHFHRHSIMVKSADIVNAGGAEI